MPSYHGANQAKHNGKNIDRLLEAVAFMMKQRRSVPELAEVMDMTNDNVAYRYMDRMHDHGLVYVCDWRIGRGKPTAIYGWNPVPWQNPDVPPPAKERRPTLAERKAMLMARQELERIGGR
jgi:hypothetical protein